MTLHKSKKGEAAVSNHIEHRIPPHARWTVLTLLAGLLLASSPAQAEQCGTQVSRGWTVHNPSPEDLREISDLLSQYAWTLDDQDALAFAGLFIQDDKESTYEYCNVGGANQVFRYSAKPTAAQQQSLQELMQLIFNDLFAHHLRTRHLITNTLFGSGPGEAVITKSTELVTTQSTNLEAPDLDYSADLRTTVEKDSKGIWKFRNVTVFADHAAVTIKKR
jgi:hypothetical protein